MPKRELRLAVAEGIAELISKFLDNETTTSTVFAWANFLAYKLKNGTFPPNADQNSLDLLMLFMQEMDEDETFEGFDSDRFAAMLVQLADI